MTLHDELLEIFLKELDKKLLININVVVFGGNALTLLCLKKKTADVDVCLDADPAYLDPILKVLRNQFNFKIDTVYGNNIFGTVIPDLQSRVIGPITDPSLQRILLYALHPVDVILCKMGRYDGRDLWDIEYALKHGGFSEKEFDERFEYLFRHYQKTKRIFLANYEDFKTRFKKYLK